MANPIFWVALIVQNVLVGCPWSHSFEKSETYDHNDHRDILKDLKTVFVPEKCFTRVEFNVSSVHKVDMSEKTSHCSKIDRSNDLLLEFSRERLRTSKNVLKIDPENEEFESLQNSMENETQNFWQNQISKEEVRDLQSRLMKKYMNLEVNPCSDFYEFACGNWKKYYTIPPDRSTYDTFEIIRENLDLALNELLKNNDTACGDNKNFPKPPEDIFDEEYYKKSNEKNKINAVTKAKYFYQSCMDQETISIRGTKPLLKILKQLGGWPIIDKNWKKDKFDLILLLAKLRLLNNDALIAQWIGPDMKNSNQHIVHIDQTTLGLPAREYYLDPKNIKYIAAYKVLILSTVNLLGANIVKADEEVDEMIKFETSLAQIMESAEDRRNISDVYLRTNIAAMTLYFPQFDWKSYFDVVLGTDIDLGTPVAVYCAKYMLELVYVLSNVDARTLQNYLIWRFVRHRINNLDEKFLEVKQRFNYVLFGREKQPKRWQFCVTQTNSHMGMALGSLFVKTYFDLKSKQDTIQMTQTLAASFKNILEENDWLDNHTKAYAQIKIDEMDLKIGFPDFILNDTELSMRYQDVQIHPNYFFENVLSILRHLTRVEQKRLGCVVNRTLWSTPPAVVNAYYSRNKNQIMFPAGILQPPFYHKHFPKALNFGGIGVVIGHEITHGFDDKGRLFDQKGNLLLWWRESSIKTFYDKAQCLIDQYSQYVLPEVKVALDGYLTQGENIADNGGLKQSFKAYEKWLSEHPEAQETLPNLNLTDRQLFFLNFAQVWCGQQRIDEAKNRIRTSVHSPGIFRILGVLSNSEDFAKAYHCPLNSPMNPEKKCRIW